MERPTVSCRWSGNYAYDLMPELEDSPTFGFVLEIESMQIGRFRGTVQDYAVEGVPEVGTVEGLVSDHRVEFIKRMPVLYMFEAGKDPPHRGVRPRLVGAVAGRPRPSPSDLLRGRVRGRWARVDWPLVAGRDHGAHPERRTAVRLGPRERVG